MLREGHLREFASALRRGVGRQVASTAGHNVASTVAAGPEGTSLVPSRELAELRPSQGSLSWAPHGLDPMRSASTRRP